jgi:hypothetical protein
MLVHIVSWLRLDATCEPPCLDSRTTTRDEQYDHPAVANLHSLPGKARADVSLLTAAVGLLLHHRLRGRQTLSVCTAKLSVRMVPLVAAPGFALAENAGITYFESLRYAGLA